MKRILSISTEFSVALVLLLSSVQLGCDTPRDVRVEQPRTLLFEVERYKSPTAYPSGRTLLIRIYKNGDVEFDKYPADLPVGGMFTVELWASTLTPDELDIFNILVAQVAAEPKTSKYGPFNTGLNVDSYTSLTIRYASNSAVDEIFVEDREASIDLRKISSSQLQELLKRSYEISNRMRKEAG